MRKILVINPGSTSDDAGYFEGDKLVFSKVVRYSPVELKPFEKQKVTAQYEFRKKNLLSALEQAKIDIKKLDAVIGRGGLVKPIPSGVYRLNEALLKDLSEGARGEHPSNLGGLLANEMAKASGCPAFIADPVVVDELEPLARFSGMPENPRISIFHALNQKRVARLAAKQMGKKYEDCNFIIMHGGGGITIGAHKNGRVIDVNNGLDGDGPFTPQRSGGVPSGGLAKLCFSGKYSYNDIKLKIKGFGGLIAYTGTSDLIALEKYVQTGEVTPNCGLDSSKTSREQAKEAVSAMAYQISKEIGSMATVIKGKIDAVVLTGGIAYDKFVVSEITERVSWIAPVLTFAGGDEKRALMEAADMALSHPEIVREYN
ncbi:MAG: butyrate kinase [Elusimicrobia bacterium]|nr:butyrate kinase [Elusimicrobiota bacterium]